MALLQDIQTRLSQYKEGVAPSATGQVQKIAQAKTGKATAGPAQKISDVGERAAQGAARTAGKAQAAKGAMTAVQLGQQAQQQDKRVQGAEDQLDRQQRMFSQQQVAQNIMAQKGRTADADVFAQNLTAQEQRKTQAITNNAEQAIQDLEAKYQTDRNNMFQGFRESTRELEFRRDASELEQVAHVMAMNDQAYVDNLMSTGKMRRLEDELQFNKESREIILGEEMQSTLRELGFLEEFDQNAREFQNTMSHIDLDAAMQIANTAISSANTQAAFEGVGKAASEYAKYEARED